MHTFWGYRCIFNAVHDFASAAACMHFSCLYTILLHSFICIRLFLVKFINVTSHNISGINFSELSSSYRHTHAHKYAHNKHGVLNSLRNSLLSEIFQTPTRVSNNTSHIFQMFYRIAARILVKCTIVPSAPWGPTLRTGCAH